MSARPSVAELLAAGAGIEELLAAVAGDGHEELHARLALARTFDEDVYPILVEGLEQAPSFEEAIALEGVEALPLQAVYRLTGAARRRALQTPVEDDDRSAVSRRLAECYCRRGDWVEAIYHEAVYAPGAALEHLEEQFELADATFSLDVARDLVEALRDRELFLDEAQLAELAGYERYLAARGRWIDDWYRSTRFVKTARVVDALERLLAGSDGRALSLWAPGGMGKTMHLRWLLAHRCVPREAGIPCAKIDFDVVEARTAASEPWLLLLELAAQLEPQMCRGGFASLLEQYGHHRLRLEARAGAPNPQDPTTAVLSADAVADIRTRFVAALEDLGEDERVVIVLDTLEEAFLPGRELTGQSNLRPLLNELAQVHHAVPEVRLVLAGRYRLTGRVRLKRLFPDVREIELSSFGEAEVEELFRLRGIDRPELIGPVLRAADGMPLQIAMFADAVEADPEIDETTIAADTRVGVFYANDRVLARIHPALAGAVRLGVLLRWIDEALMEDVLVPGVREALGTEPPPAGELWDALKRYAGSAAWVVFTDTTQEVVRFHPRIAGSMRGLLRNDPCLERIHLAAAEHFERRMDEDPDHAGAWAAEAAFHRFQLEGPRARKHWRRMLRRLDERPDARHLLTADVLGLSYIDDDRLIERTAGGPLVSRAIEVEARLELGIAAALRARAAGSPPTSVDWREARAAYDDVRAFQMTRPTTPALEHRLLLLQAFLRLCNGVLDDIEPLIEKSLKGRVSARERFSLRLAHAEALDRAGLPARKAYEAARRVAAGETRAAIATEALATYLTERGKLERATRLFVELSSSADGERAGRATLARAEIALQSGFPVRALELVRSLPATEGACGVRVQLLAASVDLALGRLDAAFAKTSAISLPAGLTSKAAARLDAERLELEGEILGQRLALAEATRSLDKAAARWNEADEPGGVCRAYVKNAEIALRLAGDHRTAWRALRHARRVSAKAAGPQQIRRLLIEAEVAATEDEPERASELIAGAVRAAEAARMPPRVLARVAMAGLAFDGAAAEAHMRTLTAAVGEVTPASARLMMLEPLQRCPRLEHVSVAARTELRDAIPSPRRAPRRYPHAHPEELERLRVLDAELDRVLDSPAGGELVEREFLPAAPAVLTPAGGPTVSLLGLAVRTGAAAIASWLAVRAYQRLKDQPSTEVPDAAVVVDSATVQSGTDALAPETRSALHAAISSLRGNDDARLWLARGWETIARDARARGQDPDEAAGRAAALYAELGDETGRLRALGLMRTAHPAPASPQALRLALEPDGVAAVSPDGRRSRVGDATIAGLALALAEGSGTEGAGWARLASHLIECPPEPGSLAPASAPSSLALFAEPRLLQALPWELALRPGSTLARTVYLHGSRRASATPAGSPPSVLVIRPGFHGPNAVRGALLTGAPAEDVYRSNGYVTRLLEDPDDDELAQTLQIESFSVVHVCGNLIDAHGTPALVLRPGLNERRAGLVYSSTFGLVARGAKRRPLVVLDPLPVATERDAMVQVLLRNAFSLDIASPEGIDAILATGCVPALQRPALLDAIAKALAAGRDVPAIATKLREEVAGAGTTAAFLRTPQ